MDCSRFRTAISARLDGEAIPAGSPREPGAGSPFGHGAGDLDAHLAQCGDCRVFATDLERLHRAVRVAPAPDVPDLAPGILAAIAAEPMRRRAPRRVWVTAPDQERALRLLLVAIGLVQIAVALPALLLGSDAGLPVHAARHLGSFDVALAVGFLFAAWKPERIPGILPVVAALVVCLVATSFLDIANGTTGASSETHHATDFAGLAVVWLLSRSTVGAPVRTSGIEPGSSRSGGAPGVTLA